MTRYAAKSSTSSLSVRPTDWNVETIAAAAGIEVAEVEKILARATAP